MEVLLNLVITANGFERSFGVITGEDGTFAHTFTPLKGEAGIYTVRIIHGKGRGMLKKRVHALLNKNARVASFKDAPPEAGGWGATLVELEK